MTDGEKTLRNHLDKLKEIDAGLDADHVAKKRIAARIKECRAALRAEHEKGKRLTNPS